ncbi:outer membrane beta-barrel protein [Lewinella cohaerens]|uniref:outer membrane beta-barrel protein n=1 Tax=Lewinella cohaerens TaxID=70995 RepID=UPI00037E20F2|nr:outer membrane beta-barrel protein [Lewinella cohaerens]
MTRLPLLLLTFLLGFSSLLAQRYSGIGVNLFPNYSHRRIVNLDLNMIGQADSLEISEFARPSYAGGIVLSYRGKKAGVQVGLNYSQTGYRGKRTAIAFNDPNRANFDDEQYSFRAQNIEIPFSVLFYQNLSEKDDFFFSLGSGLSYNLSNQDIITRFNGESSAREVNTIDSEDFRKVNYCFQTSMGWEHKLSQNMLFSIAPTFRLWLAGIYRDSLLNRNLYQFGLRATVRFDRELEFF